MVLKLGAWTFDVAMMKKQLQPTHDLLFVSVKKRDDLMGTEKTMPVHKPDDLTVAFRRLDGCNRGNALETRGTFFLHLTIMKGMDGRRETAEVANEGKHTA